ncbi:hypothetical protein FMEAI12_1730015 [Parafrankia sp. Ea1.12]|nr:hypothetical protein FMEAI12_1730015 [Parafrankia sp. Ea1.12]
MAACRSPRTFSWPRATLGSPGRARSARVQRDRRLGPSRGPRRRGAGCGPRRTAAYLAMFPECPRVSVSVDGGGAAFLGRVLRRLALRAAVRPTVLAVAAVAAAGVRWRRRVEW